MRFLAPFALLSALGLAGLLSILPLLGPVLLKLRELPGMADRPNAALALLVLAQPALLMLAGTAVGVAVGERVGLRSLLVRVARGEPVGDAGGFGLALGLGLALGATLILGDLALRHNFPRSFEGLGGVLGEGGALVRINALLYGGIVEELVMRFGLMTLLLWLAGLACPETFAARPSLLAWPAILLAALAFAAAHLPGLAAAVPLDAVLVERTLLLNGVAGAVYGWLYWRHALEHAMAAHAATHLAFWVLGPALLRAAALLR